MAKNQKKKKSNRRNIDLKKIGPHQKQTENKQTKTSQVLPLPDFYMDSSWWKPVSELVHKDT